jgi:hypothetical protein
MVTRTRLSVACLILLTVLGYWHHMEGDCDANVSSVYGVSIFRANGLPKHRQHKVPSHDANFQQDQYNHPHTCFFHFTSKLNVRFNL